MVRDLKPRDDGHVAVRSAVSGVAPKSLQARANSLRRRGPLARNGPSAEHGPHQASSSRSDHRHFLFCCRPYLLPTKTKAGAPMIALPGVGRCKHPCLEDGMKHKAALTTVERGIQAGDIRHLTNLNDAWGKGGCRPSRYTYVMEKITMCEGSANVAV